MAGAVAALSLTAKISRMVAYGGAVVATASRLYASQAGTNFAKDVDQLRCLTQEVETMLGSLEQNAPCIPSTAAPED